jgi:nucleoside-diphosphate-sugar epimerase
MSTTQPPRALVTGASGFIGRHLVAALGAKGIPVRALVRNEEGADRVRTVAAGYDVGFAFGDVRDADSLVTAAADCQLVFHLAGTHRCPPGEMRAVHVGGTFNLLGALEPGARVVYVSSTSVYGWGRLWPVDDTMPAQPNSSYGRAKLTAEGLVQRWEGGSAVIARPTIVYGLGDDSGTLARIVGLLQLSGFRLPGNGQNRMHLTHIDDVVDGLVRLGDRGEGVFILAGPEAVPVSRVFGLLTDGAGLARPRFGISAGLLRAAAASVEAVWSVAAPTFEAPLTGHAVDVVTRDRAYAAERARRELGWSPQVQLEQGLPLVGSWLADQLRPA